MFRYIALIAPIVVAASSVHAQNQILPDLFVDPVAMEFNSITTDNGPGDAIHPGRVKFQFRSSIPNLGPGEFRLEATGVPSGNGTRQTVDQVIQATEGESNRRDAGGFEYNPGNQHMEAQGWVAYRLREVLPGDGVGPILGIGAKTSVNITNSTKYDPEAGPRSFELGGGPTHGITVGWTDIYSKNLPNQWVDATHLPPGEYWLEMVVDPADHILEEDETNNTARIKVTLIHEALPPFLTHTGDANADQQISLSEALRVVQIYNIGSYRCLADTEDEYSPGTSIGIQQCRPHSSDYDPQDWSISFTELLRFLQLFNAPGYNNCGEGEDGYCIN